MTVAAEPVRTDAEAESGAGTLALRTRRRGARARAWLLARARGRRCRISRRLARLEATAAFVAEVTREAYPDLQSPITAAGGILLVGGVDRWQDIAGAAQWPDAAASARAPNSISRSCQRAARCGRRRRLALSRAKTGLRSGAPKGLARREPAYVPRRAVLRPIPREPWRVDAGGSRHRARTTLGAALSGRRRQSSCRFEGRAALLRRLGDSARRAARIFGRRCRATRNWSIISRTVRASRIAARRPGALFDGLSARSGRARSMVDGSRRRCRPHPAVAHGERPTGSCRSTSSRSGWPIRSRAARGGRPRGRPAGRAHRPCRISQRRAARRSSA